MTSEQPPFDEEEGEDQDNVDELGASRSPTIIQNIESENNMEDF